jgi:hypothetical protein
MRVMTEELRGRISRKLLGHPVSPETRIKISLSGKGRKLVFTPEHCAAISNSLTGTRLSDEHKLKLRMAKLGRKLTPEHRRKIGEANIGKNSGKVRTPEMRLAMSLRLRGKGAANWRGGLNEKKYCDGWRIIRGDIRRRDNNTCRVCNEVGGKRRLSVHHIDYNRDNNNPVNLITLCGKCHGVTGFNRESWASYFNTLLLMKPPNSIELPLSLIS